MIPISKSPRSLLRLCLSYMDIIYVQETSPQGTPFDDTSCEPMSQNSSSLQTLGTGWQAWRSWWFIWERLRPLFYFRISSSEFGCSTQLFHWILRWNFNMRILKSPSHMRPKSKWPSNRLGKSSLPLLTKGCRPPEMSLGMPRGTAPCSEVKHLKDAMPRGKVPYQ